MKIAEAVKLLQECRWAIDNSEAKVNFKKEDTDNIREAIGLLDFPRRKNSLPGVFIYPTSGKRESDRAVVNVADILENYAIEFQDKRKAASVVR